MNHHAAGGEVGALLPLLAVAEEAVEGPNTIGHEVVRLEEVKVLVVSAQAKEGQTEKETTHVMVYADIDILAAVLLLLDEASSEAAAPGIDDGATLLPLDGRMQAEVLPTCQAEASELLFVPELVGTILHKGLELGQGLFDLRHGTGAVYELTLLGVVLLVCDDEGKQRDCLAGTRGHLQDTVATCIEGSWKGW